MRFFFWLQFSNCWAAACFSFSFIVFTLHDVTWSHAACFFSSLCSSSWAERRNCGCAMIPPTTVTRCPKSSTRCQLCLFTRTSFKSKATIVFSWKIFLFLAFILAPGAWNQLSGTPAARFGQAARRDPFPKHWLFLDRSWLWLRAQLHWDTQRDLHHQLLTNVRQLPVDLPGRWGTQVCSHRKMCFVCKTLLLPEATYHSIVLLLCPLGTVKSVFLHVCFTTYCPHQWGASKKIAELSFVSIYHCLFLLVCFYQIQFWTKAKSEIYE